MPCAVLLVPHYVYYHNIDFSCPCVRDRCGHGHNKFAGRVQNHQVRFSFHKMAILLSVCVTDVGVAVTNLQGVCKTITCVSSFHRNGHIILS